MRSTRKAGLKMNLIFKAIELAFAVIAFVGIVCIGFIVIIGLVAIAANIVDAIHDKIWWRL